MSRMSAACAARAHRLSQGRDRHISVPSSSRTPPLPRALISKGLAICELPHIGTAKISASSMRRRGNAKMLAWIIAVVLAIGLIWSVAAMSNLVPVVDSGSAAISRPAKYLATGSSSQSAATKEPHRGGTAQELENHSRGVGYG